MKDLYYFLRDIVRGQEIIFEMVRYEFRAKYLGSYLGIVWAFIHPIVTIAVLWFVFSFGFKSGSVHDIAFVPWLAAGMIPWFYFSDTINDAASSILSNSFLVKKTDFRLSLLPIVKIYANAIVHVALVFLLYIIIIMNGYPPKIIWIQLLYYYFCMATLILGLSWSTSSIAVFTKDVNNIIAVALQIGFWATPIFWNVDSIPASIAPFIKVNPVYYIVNGYRDTLFLGVPFWEHPKQTIVFWLVVFFIWLAGFFIYRKLRPHFADVI
uniref:Transport permease protein n=1 Tax=Desulfovibrio sp. U5L TaxID=596152 RepID=I2Q7S0_9BACT